MKNNLLLGLIIFPIVLTMGVTGFMYFGGYSNNNIILKPNERKANEKKLTAEINATGLEDKDLTPQFKESNSKIIAGTIKKLSKDELVIAVDSDGDSTVKINPDTIYQKSGDLSNLNFEQIKIGNKAQALVENNTALNISIE